MSDLIIKPSGTSANFKVQNPSGTDKIVMNSSGTITTGTLGSGVTFPSGHIIQVKNHKTTTRGSASVTGASPAYNTGASYTTFTFTPHKSTSKLLLTSTTINVQESSNSGDNPWLCAAYDTTLIGSVLNYMSWNHWKDAKDCTLLLLIIYLIVGEHQKKQLI